MANKKPGPKPDPSNVRDALTQVRSSRGWKEAIDELADFDRAPSTADLIDRAIVAYARQVRYPKPIPKR